MSYSVSVFSELRSKFNTFSELQTYLTSADGGNLRIVNGDDRFKIIRYVKGTSDLKLPHTRWFRSVVWDVMANVPVCVAPPKAESTAPPTGEASQFLMIQDFLEGTMINVFRHASNPDKLVVTTRTQLGATGSFYSKKSFYEMFVNALAAQGMTEAAVAQKLPAVSEETPSSFASFLLMHPEHRVVRGCMRPSVDCIHVGTVHADGRVDMKENPQEFPFPIGHEFIQYPVTGFRSDADLESFFRTYCKTQPWYWQGLVLKDGQGHRWRMRNPNYLYLRELRGGEATAVERFLRVRSQRKVMEYLKHYREERKEFGALEGALRLATQAVFDAYKSVHKAHEKKLADINKSIQPFVFRLHAHYLEHLKPQGETVRMKDAIELVNNSALYEQKRLIAAP